MAQPPGRRLERRLAGDTAGGGGLSDDTSGRGQRLTLAPPANIDFGRHTRRHPFELWGCAGAGGEAGWWTYRRC